MDAKSRKLWKDRSVKSAIFSSSLERELQAKAVNAREQVRLEKHQREIELFKNDAQKSLTSEKMLVKSRMESLRRIVFRSQSIDTPSSKNSKDDFCLRLPKLSKTAKNVKSNIEAIEFCTSVPDLHSLDQDSGENLFQLPLIRGNTPREDSQTFTDKEYKINGGATSELRNRTRSYSDFRRDARFIMAEASPSYDPVDIQCSCLENIRPLKEEKLYTSGFKPVELSRLSSRRRSLSTGDISLAERIHSFLESVESCHMDHPSELRSSGDVEDEVFD